MKSVQFVFQLAFISLSLICISNIGRAQQFPNDWIGNWKGDLEIYNSMKTEPVMHAQMELEIKAVNDSTWNWNIQYITGEKVDLRSYSLQSTENPQKWLIDEKNGIILNQTLIGKRLTSAFSLDKTQLISTYWMENETLHFEIIVSHLDPESYTGEGNDNSPKVGNHPVNSYQHTVLKRIKN